MNRAIFLGSFNPPHKGHVACIKSLLDSGMMEHLEIEKVHVIPCYQNPNKSNQIPFLDRYRMTTLMFAELAATGKVIVDDIEQYIEPNFTSDMIEWFKSGEDEHIDNNFYWVITMETLQEIIDGKWHDSEKLLKENKFIILYNEDDCLYDAIQLVKKDILDAVSIRINYDEQVSYHSTQLRENAKNGQDISLMTNDAVAEYVKEHKLYR